MEYRPLGKTDLMVSVAGLGCGGNSRLGLGRGASVDDCVAVVRAAVDLGVNFLDTAEAYGTEEIVGAAARCYDRDRLVISTKAIFKAGEDTGETVTRRVEAGLRRLGLDYVDIFHFHAVAPAAYDYHRDVLAPALIKLKEQGEALAKTLGPHHAALMRAHGLVLVAESARALFIDAVHFKENATAQMQTLQAGARPLPLTAAEITQIERMEMRDWHIKKLWNYYMRKGLKEGVLPREWADALVPTKEMMRRERMV